MSLKEIHGSPRTWQRSTRLLHTHLPAHPPKQALPVHRKGVRGGTPCLLPAFSEKPQRWFFFPTIPAVPVGPCGLVLCLESAVTTVLWNAKVVVQGPWDLGGPTRRGDSSNSPHVAPLGGPGRVWLHLSSTWMKPESPQQGREIWGSPLAAKDVLLSSDLSHHRV